MFRKAYVRGVNKALIDTGAVKYANEELAAEAADAVAETMPEQPMEEMAPEQTAELATTLVELSNQLGAASESAANAAQEVAAGPAEGMPIEAADARAEKAASILRQKLSQNDTGSTITGEKPHQQNTQPMAETAEAKMDLRQRPEGYANVGEDGVGAQEASGDGAIGDESVVQGTGAGPVAMDGTNSATDAIKSANIRNLIKKVAMGSTLDPSNPAQMNTQAQAAQTTGEGAMEAKARPENYAVKGEKNVGKSDQQAEERASAVGSEKAHPESMGPVGKGGTNTAIQQIANGKTAEDEEWLKRFKEASAKYASVLPFWMEDNEKIAAVQYLMSLSPSEAKSIASHIEKTAELPEGLKAYVEKKKGNGEMKEEKEEKGEEEENEEEEKEEMKEASLRAGDIIQRLRQLST